MNITDVKVKKVNADGKVKGFATMTIDDAFVVREIRIVEGQKGLFVAMPSRKTPEGDFKDIAHPITTEARQLIHDAVMKAYNEAE